MASQEYWKNRETEAKKHNIIDEEEYNRQIQEIYQSMIDEITKEINGFYARYAKKEGITMAEAKKRADKIDIDGRKRRRWLRNSYCRTAGSSSICICRYTEDRSLRGREESSSF